MTSPDDTRRALLGLGAGAALAALPIAASAQQRLRAPAERLMLSAAAYGAVGDGSMRHPQAANRRDQCAPESNEV